jgi:hypothetical protein
MNDPVQLYFKIGRQLPAAQESQMFGKPCFKTGGKAFISLFDNELVCKLNGEVHSEALSLDGCRRFDPSKKNRPLKEWVQIPFDYSNLWNYFAREALQYVSNKIGG